LALEPAQLRPIVAVPDTTLMPRTPLSGEKPG